MERIRLASDCSIFSIDSRTDLSSFCCGDSDLDDFFRHDAFLYSKQLLGKSYIAVTNVQNPQIVCAFTLANDSIKSTMIPKASRNRLERKVPNAKHTRTYPALLIGRLGVNGIFQRSCSHLGSQVLDYLISWFVHPDNKTGCRFMVVDAYNRKETISFYQKNGFKFLYSDETLEKEAFHVDESAYLNTRMMYLDLIDFVQE